MCILATLAIPTYTKNAATGRGYATFDDRSVEFGPYDDPQSLMNYDRTLASWLGNGRRLPPDGPSPPAAASPSGGPRPIPWTEFSAELLSMYHISMRAAATRRGMVEAIGFLTQLGTTTTFDLTTGLVARWVATQRPTLSPNSVKGRLRYIQRICNYAYGQGYLAVNPFVVAPMRTWVRSVPSKRKQFHSREEISRVLGEMRRQIDTSNGWAQWRARRTFAVTCVFSALGLRANECYHLYASDIDLAARTLSVVARSKRLKTAGSAATLPLCPWIVPHLEEWVSHRMDRPDGFLIDDGCPWLFPATRRRAPWTSGSPGCKPRDRLAAAALAVGVAGFTPLSLRHSAATNLTALGAGPNLVRLLLRHTNNSTQQWYVHSSADVLREGVKGVSF